MLLLTAATLTGEVHTLTLREAVERALEQNPDLIIARLDEQKATHSVRVALDPFIPKAFVGSGLAYSSGFPLSMEGAAPSIVQARGVASVINRPQRYRLRESREEAKQAAISTEAKRDDVVFRTAALYLDAEFAARKARAVSAQVDSLERVLEAIQVRVREGRELPIEAKRAQLDVARARQRVQLLESDQEFAESSLANVLGYGPADLVRAVAEERDRVELPSTADAAAAGAVENDPELRRLESTLAARRFSVKAEDAAKMPRVNLIAQYALLSRFNNYDRFFNDFQRHNGQIGVSVEVPVYTGPGVKARVARAQTEIARLQAELNSTRGQISLDARRDFQEVEKAETAVEVATLDLDLARDNLSIILARMQEGRAAIRDVEAARYLENEKWLAFYDAHHTLELARYRLLHRTGNLLAAVR